MIYVRCTWAACLTVHGRDIRTIRFIISSCSACATITAAAPHLLHVCRVGYFADDFTHLDSLVPFRLLLYPSHELKDISGILLQFNNPLRTKLPTGTSYSLDLDRLYSRYISNGVNVFVALASRHTWVYVRMHLATAGVDSLTSQDTLAVAEGAAVTQHDTDSDTIAIESNARAVQAALAKDTCVAVGTAADDAMLEHSKTKTDMKQTQWVGFYSYGVSCSAGSHLRHHSAVCTVGTWQRCSSCQQC